MEKDVIKDVQKEVERVIEETLRIYPDAVDISVAFYHQKDGRGPFVDIFRITLENGRELTDYRITDEIEEELDKIRMAGYGYYFSIDILDKEVY